MNASSRLAILVLTVREPRMFGSISKEQFGSFDGNYALLLLDWLGCFLFLSFFSF